MACKRHMPLLARQSMEAGLQFGSMMPGGEKMMADMESQMKDYLPEVRYAALSLRARARVCPSGCECPDTPCVCVCRLPGGEGSMAEPACGLDQRGEYGAARPWARPGRVTATELVRTAF